MPGGPQPASGIDYYLVFEIFEIRWVVFELQLVKVGANFPRFFTYQGIILNNQRSLLRTSRHISRNMCLTADGTRGPKKRLFFFSNMGNNPILVKKIC